MNNIIEPVRALSWKEPFASLMLYGKIETRTWNTKYRGLVLICASKTDYKTQQMERICGEIQHLRAWQGIVKSGANINMNKGNAIAIGRLIDSRPMQISDEDKCFVKHDLGLWCHIYKDVRAIKPLPWKGSQGWRTVDQSIVNKIEFM